MKSIFFISILTLTLVSCKSSSHTPCNAHGNLQIEDSTKVKGYDPYQRSFANYLLSLSEEEKNKWINGTYTEEEKNVFLDTVSYNINQHLEKRQ